LAYRVSKVEFERLVERALGELPAKFADFLEEVPVEVQNRPTRKQLKSVGLDEDHLLLGLYDGLPLTQRSVEHSGVRPAVIYIFKEDIELASDTEEELIEQVRTTVLHEIGHHFGMSEDDLDELGYG
jgi:predicted Zn-dependent protease with MMP-like domain